MTVTSLPEISSTLNCRDRIAVGSYKLMEVVELPPVVDKSVSDGDGSEVGEQYFI